MASSELAIDVTSWAMRLEQMKADTASRNIANSSIQGSRPQQVQFAAQLEGIRAALQGGDVQQQDVATLLAQPFSTVSVSGQSLNGGISLDAEVADLTSAELRYKTLAEALSRQLSLLTLAASGKQ